LQLESELGRRDHPTELSVFIFCIRLRRISSSIHAHFFSHELAAHHSARTPIRAGNVYLALRKFSNELDQWRSEAPIFTNPRSLYERAEWYDFLLEKDKLGLARAAINVVPRHKGQRPPEEFVALCMTSATRVVEMYSQLSANGAITWTRNYFQIIFSAGISILYCISLHVKETTLQSSSPDLESALTAVTDCTSLLRHFAKKMPDASGFASFFREMRRSVLGKDRTARPSRPRHDRNNSIESTAAGTGDGRSSAVDPSPSEQDPSYGWGASLTQSYFDEYPELNFNTGEFGGLDFDFIQGLETDAGEFAWGFFPDNESFTIS
jgi:hypothetical protein